jgi:hypothetical protein
MQAKASTASEFSRINNPYSPSRNENGQAPGDGKEVAWPIVQALSWAIDIVKMFILAATGRNDSSVTSGEMTRSKFTQFIIDSHYDALCSAFEEEGNDDEEDYNYW